MIEGVEFDVRQFVLSSSPLGPVEIDELREAIADDRSKFNLLRDASAELSLQEERSPAMSVRLGVCQYLLGRFKLATMTLQQGDGGALAHYFMARSHIESENYTETIASVEAAATAGYHGDQCALLKTEALRLSGRLDEALATLNGLSGAVEQTADYLYQRGSTVAAMGGNPEEVVALYERAVDSEPRHAGALFGLALENDRRGNDEIAVSLYERSVARFPANVGSLLNLGVLYEDREEYEKAYQCYDRILETYPNHARAQLYLKDTVASRNMFYDEEAQKKRDRLSQVLSIPVTDFELSVRSRNCLQKMGITMLGDLARTTEAHLLASKNFGETSLVEIREMLSSKGLDLGQFATGPAEVEPLPDSDSLSPDERAMLDRPISDLNLSVRARKCMIRLGIATIGELVRRSGDDMLECKNFGVTSLNEVREKLTPHGLKLRGE